MQSYYQRFGKRIFDLVIAVIGIILFIPLLGSIAILVRLKLSSPVLFLHERPGLAEKSFLLFKFRTMNNARDRNGKLLPDEQRMTPFGRALRTTSLDELPELFNVFKGEMSIVGPRPLLKEYLPLYNKMQKRRHEVKPGITGWAQVNGRNAIGWEQKFEHDIWYVDNQSFRLDIKIMALTIWKILKREGISQPGQATAEKFKGHS